MHPKRAVKYCGGCNSRYDRVKAVRMLEEQFGEKLPAAQAGECYDELYVICGCTAKCADVSALKAKHYIWVDAMEHPGQKFLDNPFRST